MEKDSLINARKSRKWSQQKLAELLGVDQSTVSRWESGGPMSGPALRMIKILFAFSDETNNPVALSKDFESRAA